MYVLDFITLHFTGLIFILRAYTCGFLNIKLEVGLCKTATISGDLKHVRIQSCKMKHKLYQTSKS